jgi:hypothetical protein
MKLKMKTADNKGSSKSVPPQKGLFTGPSFIIKFFFRSSRTASQGSKKRDSHGKCSTKTTGVFR